MPKKTTSTKKAAKSETIRVSKVGEDFKNAALIVSVIINLMVFIGWLALQVTSKYDEQVANFLFGS